MRDGTQLRQDVDRLIAAGDAPAAWRRLRELWGAAANAATAPFVVSRFEQLRLQLGLPRYRLDVLRSFTVEPVIPLLRASAIVAGIDLVVRLADFNAYAQEIFDPASALYNPPPDAVILAVQTRDVAPELWRDFSALTPEQVGSATQRVTGEFRSWVGGFRRHTSAHLIIHNLERPAQPGRGVLDAQGEGAQAFALEQLNRELRALAAECTGVYLLDYDALVARHGRLAWHDERKWLTVRLPIAAPHLDHLAREWLRFLHPLSGTVAKAIAVDLDNTLWGGVIGEVGMAGIHLGPEYPGAAYQELQRALLDIKRRGVLLTICSKNNRDDAMEALEGHPGMLLKPGDFAAMRINWADKAQNLRELASELNLGIDSLAFLDDNPIERQQVRLQLPEVFVLELPSEPMDFARTLRDWPVLERLAVTAEDRERGAMYQAQTQRERLAEQVVSREDFYRSLEQEATIAPLTTSSLARIAQLTNKTNQFNLTTRRYTAQQLTDLVDAEGCDCFSIRVKDRFGDNGLVGVAITRREGSLCEIDSFLLSCRVIGRTVETAFLAYLAEHARRHGASRLQGWFLPTRKNLPARDFYRDHGFSQAGENGDGTLWSLDLTGGPPACPEWVRLEIRNGDEGR